MPPLPPIPTVLAIALVIFFAIGIHEYAHCKFADMAGDPTPRAYGRVTLDLTKHFEPAGTLMMVISSLYGIGIGWGRPAPISPSKMRNPRWDAFTAVAAGPISNLCQAFLFALLLRIFMASGQVTLGEVMIALSRDSNQFVPALLVNGVVLNLALFCFNLVPLGPLDGHWIVGYLLPERWQPNWFHFNRTVGGPILIGLILISQVSRFPLLSIVIFPILSRLFKIATGIQL